MVPEALSNNSKASFNLKFSFSVFKLHCNSTTVAVRRTLPRRRATTRPGRPRRLSSKAEQRGRHASKENRSDPDGNLSTGCRVSLIDLQRLKARQESARSAVLPQ